VGFFDKVNNSMIVCACQEVFGKTDREAFYENFAKFNQKVPCCYWKLRRTRKPHTLWYS